MLWVHNRIRVSSNADSLNSNITTSLTNSYPITYTLVFSHINAGLDQGLGRSDGLQPLEIRKPGRCGDQPCQVRMVRSARDRSIAIPIMEGVFVNKPVLDQLSELRSSWQFELCVTQ